MQLTVRGMFVPINLPSIVYIMPNAVEPAGHGGYRREERITEPYGEHGIFLAKRLTGGNLVVICNAELPAEPELQDTCEQRDKHEAQLSRWRHCAVHHTSHRHRDGNGKRESPEVESEIGH